MAWIENDTDVLEGIPSTGLEWPRATEEQLAFMKQVYDTNLLLAEKKGKFIGDIPKSDLQTIEGSRRAKTSAALACRALLKSARDTIADQKLNVKIGLTSAYRSASQQFELWGRYFPKYYTDTRADRQALPEGEHSGKAVELLARHIRKWIAMPGFSNHQSGIAFDFLNEENGQAINNNSKKASIASWRSSWFWNWLNDNASNYSIYPYEAEPWHWEYHPERDAKQKETIDAPFCDTLSVGEERIETMPAEGGGTFKRLKDEDIHYLVWEGGGGKGFAYPGAIEVLQERSIIRFKIDPRDGLSKLDPDGQIKGMAGSSAGGMTALFLALGYNSDEIKNAMNKMNFNSFFDLPILPREIPSVTGCKKKTADESLLVLDEFVDVFSKIPGLPGEQLLEFGYNQFKQAYRNAPPSSSSAKEKLKKHPLMYLESLYYDYGIFSGCQVQAFFERLIRAKLNKANATFRDLFEFNRSKIKLVLTGTNIQTQKLEYLSVDKTPLMPVSAAIRITMSLPFVFKPMVITRAEAQLLERDWLEGVWVDGGLKENLPISAFENEPDFPKPHTLGFRLGKDSKNPVNGLLTFIFALVNTTIDSEALVSPTSGYAEQTIVIDTLDLSTTDFDPPLQKKLAASVSAKEATIKYFAENLQQWFQSSTPQSKMP